MAGNLDARNSTFNNDSGYLLVGTIIHSENVNIGGKLLCQVRDFSYYSGAAEPS